MTNDPLGREALIAAAGGGFTHPWVVRLQDVDAAGVVFFARVFELFNDALMAYLDQKGLSVRKMMDSRRLALPIRHAQADFLVPLRLGDRLEVQLVASRIGAEEAIVGYRLSRSPPDAADGDEARVAAVGQTHHVCASLETFRRERFPEDLAVALRSLGA